MRLYAKSVSMHLDDNSIVRRNCAIVGQYLLDKTPHYATTISLASNCQKERRTEEKSTIMKVGRAMGMISTVHIKPFTVALVFFHLRKTLPITSLSCVIFTKNLSNEP